MKYHGRFERSRIGPSRNFNPKGLIPISILFLFSCWHETYDHRKFSFNNLSYLMIFLVLVVVDNGAMNADRYIRNIHENFIFMDDYARPHRPRIVQEYLEEVEVSRMEWPARSSDLNPIEQVWDNLNRGLRSSENHPATLNDLGIQLREIWEGLDQNILGSLILSMIRRCLAVLHARGGNTKY